MQDFDYSKYYKNQNRETQAQAGGKLKSKAIFWGVLLTVVYLSGVFTGIYINDEKVIQGDSAAHQVARQNGENVNVVADVHPDQGEKPDNKIRSAEEITQQLQSNEAEFIILAKVYASKEKAHLHGMTLLNSGLPVFLAESGKKTKVYVGPVSGRENAYSMLAKVKKIPEFKGAIMYER